jgi:hypothetical protein
MNIGQFLVDFGSNFLMHFSFVSLVVIRLVVYLFIVLNVSNSCTNFCPVQLTKLDLHVSLFCSLK